LKRFLLFQFWTDRRRRRGTAVVSRKSSCVGLFIHIKCPATTSRFGGQRRWCNFVCGHLHATIRVLIIIISRSTNSSSATKECKTQANEGNSDQDNSGRRCALWHFVNGWWRRSRSRWRRIQGLPIWKSRSRRGRRIRCNESGWNRLFKSRFPLLSVHVCFEEQKKHKPRPFPPHSATRKRYC